MSGNKVMKHTKAKLAKSKINKDFRVLRSIFAIGWLIVNDAYFISFCRDFVCGNGFANPSPPKYVSHLKE